MSSLGNKEVLAKNLQYYIAKSGKDRKELADIWNFPYSTVSEWINAKKYPRIDRIEIMADYFGIQKSDLIEERITEEESKKNDAIVSIIKKLRKNEKLLSTVLNVCELDEEGLETISRVSAALIK